MHVLPKGHTVTKILSAGLLVLIGTTELRSDEAEDRAAKLFDRLGFVGRDRDRPGKPVVEVDVSSSKVTDADLKELAACKSLNVFIARGTTISDAGVKELEGLKTL